MEIDKADQVKEIDTAENYGNLNSRELWKFI